MLLLLLLLLLLLISGTSGLRSNSYALVNSESAQLRSRFASMKNVMPTWDRGGAETRYLNAIVYELSLLYELPSTRTTFITFAHVDVSSLICSYRRRKLRILTVNALFDFVFLIQYRIWRKILLKLVFTHLKMRTEHSEATVLHLHAFIQNC